MRRCVRWRGWGSRRRSIGFRSSPGHEYAWLDLRPSFATARISARRRGAVAFLGLLAASACGTDEGFAPTDAGTLDTLGQPASVDAGTPETGPEFFTVVVLPDTQYSYYSSPSFFDAETRWIAANVAAERIAFVLHEGDIVDSPLDPAQWAAARASMAALDGKVPYVLTVGNHDLALTAQSNAPRTTLLNDAFPYTELENAPGFGGAFEAGHRENAYYLLPGGGRTWLVLALEFSPRPAVLAWAAQVLDDQKQLPAIVVTHAYLYSDGTRYDLQGRVCQFTGDCVTPPATGPAPQCWNPVCYLGDGSDGGTIWNTLVLPHSNIVFVFSGHVANPAPNDAARLSSLRPDGTVCHQLLADYQADGTTGGDGYFRLLRISTDGLVQVRTFSPYVDPASAFLTDDRNQFEVQVALPNP